MSTLAPTRPHVLPALVTTAWFVVAYLLAQAGAYQEGSRPPWQIGLVIVLPVAAVGIALRASPAFRSWARSLDLGLLIQLQAWRLIGFAFIALSANNLLAETFAIPASLGDIAIAVTAPFMAAYVVRRGATAPFYAWTAFGILDLVVAVTLGVLHAPGRLGILHDNATGSGVVNSLPVVLIPTFVVPLMIILHLLTLTHVRSAVRQP